MPPLRQRRKSKRNAPCVIHYTQRRNDEGKKQLCVYAECTFGGTISRKPVWGHGDQSVRRALATLSKMCECGRPYHSHRYTEGRKVSEKKKGK